MDGTYKEINKELQKIQSRNNEPKDEPEIIPIIENKIPKKGIKYKEGDEPKQYKLNIPKKFSDEISLNKEDFEAKITLHKTPEMKITIELVKKNESNI